MKSTKYNKTEKGKASEKLRAAVRYGKTERRPCEKCGEPNAHGHHEDYSKPLDVVWLCAKHHAQRHLKEKWQIKLLDASYKGGFLLSELIEACGDSFFQVGRHLDYWVAISKETYQSLMDRIIGEGQTPEIAVANLWLKLNEKEKLL